MHGKLMAISAWEINDFAWIDFRTSMVETPIPKHPWVSEHPKKLRDGLLVNTT
jgi:hypothetical protein